MKTFLISIGLVFLIAFWIFYFGILLPVLVSSKDTILVISGLLSLMLFVILPVVGIGRHILKIVKEGL